MAEHDLSKLEFVKDRRWVKGVLRLLSDKGSLASFEINPRTLEPHLDEISEPENDSMFGSPLDTALEALLAEELMVLRPDNRLAMTNLGHMATGHFNLIVEQ